MEKALTIQPMAQLTPEAIAAFAETFARFDTSGGLMTLGELLQDSIACEVLESGSTVAWFAVRSYQHRDGNEAELLIAAGRASVDLTHVVLPYIEKAVAPAKALTIYTRRPGLMRKLMKVGYRADAFVLRKTIGAIQ